MRILSGDTRSDYWLDIKAHWREEGQDILVVEFPVQLWDNEAGKSVEVWYTYVFFMERAIMSDVLAKTREFGWREALPWKGYNVVFVNREANFCLDKLEELYPEAKFFDLNDGQEEDSDQEPEKQVPRVANGD